LDERNREIGAVNAAPRVFVISSSEAKPVVDQLVLSLSGEEITVETWDRALIGVSDYPISALMDAIKASDFTISVVRADDSLVRRDKASKTARDNVHLEYGISPGVLGHRRSILLVCAGKDLHLPSDLAGLTTLRYLEGSKDDLRLSVRTASIEARTHILEVGVRSDQKAGEGKEGHDGMR
jgi:predicted nucleotide-binding protein